MAVELKPGSASAAAHKEAGTKAADFVRDFVRETGAGGGGGEDEPSPAPSDPVDDTPDDDPGDGPSPEPTPPADPAKTPDKDDDDEDLDDDYDEEDVAQPAPAEDGTPPPAPAATDSDKTWSQYKTEEERKKALHENKAYGIRMANEAKTLREENERLKAGTSPGAGAAPKDPAASPPQPDTVETVLRRLVETDPQVASAVNALQTQRESIAGHAQQIEKLRETVSATEDRQGRAQHVLEYLEERLKTEPDNFELQEVIKAKRIEITSLETSANSGHIKLARLENDLGKDQDRYRQGLAHVREFAVTNARASEDKAKEDAVFKANYDKANKEWDAAIPKVYEKFKITNPKIQKRINVMLLKAAAVESDDIDNIEGWMLKQGAEIHEVLEEARADAIKGYRTSKNRDAHQPAPEGAAAVATQEPRVARNSREADRIAGKRLKESLAGGRS